MNNISFLLQQLFTTGKFGHLMLGDFLMNTLVVWFMVHFLYYRKSRRRDFYFTFMLIGIVIYFLVYFMIYVLEDLKGKTGIGIGLGLFGIFSIMRYRTDAMPVREMTYLFSIICLAVVNALASSISIGEFLLPNVVVIAAVALCEHFLLRKAERSKLIQYDRIALIKPETREQLLEDLRQRLGLEITRVDIGSIDFLRDTALIRIYYKQPNNQTTENDIDNTIKLKREQWEEVK